MDPLVKAAILVAVVYGLTEMAKALLPQIETSRRLTVLTALVLSEATVFLVAASVWAHSQVVNGTALDNMNVATKILVGFMLAGTSAFGDRVLNAVKNVGENQVQKPIAK